MTSQDEATTVLWERARPHQLELAEALRARLGHVAGHPTDAEAWQEARAFAQRLADGLGSYAQVLAVTPAWEAASALDGLLADVEHLDVRVLPSARALAEAACVALAEPG